MTKSSTMSLDDISSAFEQIAKTLQTATSTSHAMSLGEVVAYATAQVGQATKEPRDAARARLATMKRLIDSVIVQVAKATPEQLEAQTITFQVETAFAPSGGPTIEGLTTGTSQSSSDRALITSPPNADTNFSQNLAEVAKALASLKAAIPSSSPPATRDAPPPAHRADAAEWPMDLNSESFRKGNTKEVMEPVWGFDPDDAPGTGG